WRRRSPSHEQPSIASGSCPRRRSGAGWLLRSRGSSDQSVVELSELLVAVELDDDSTALARAGEGDLRAEPPAEVVFDAFEVRIGRPWPVGTQLAWLTQPADELLGLTDAERLLDGARGDPCLLLERKTADRAGVTRGEPS